MRLTIFFLTETLDEDGDKGAAGDGDVAGMFCPTGEAVDTC